MTLTLENITKTMGGETHIDDVSMTLEPGSFNVLLGRTLAGKTTLMRIMAGLEPPTKGRILVDNADVTGQAVQKRNVAMVYQQFINYPAMTVFENIEFGLEESEASFVIATTRPELLAACVGVTAHPEDDRYKKFFGQRAVTPLFKAPVPNSICTASS